MSCTLLKILLKSLLKFNWIESQIVETDPLNNDSDGDGVSDGEEVDQGSDPHDSEDDAPPPETQVAQIRLTGTSLKESFSP